MKTIKEALVCTIIFMFICGVVYPFGITLVSQIVFKDKSNGSIIEVDGEEYGSELLAQNFTEDKYLWGRIMKIDVESFKDENGNAVMYAAPSNLSPASEEYEVLIEERINKLKKSNPTMEKEGIPVDLVTCSGSGLDPHISLEAAEYQVERIAKARKINAAKVREIIVKYTEKKFLGVVGEERVNVLKVNLALDGILK